MAFEVTQKTAPKKPIKKVEKTAVQAEAELKAQAQKIAIQEEMAYRKGAVSIRDLIAPASMKVTPSFILLGDVYLRTLFVITYPRYVGVGWFSPIINFNSTLSGISVPPIPTPVFSRSKAAFMALRAFSLR